MLGRCASAFSVGAVALAMAAPADGAVTVGSDMIGSSFGNVACGPPPCTQVINKLPPNLNALSPIDGVVVRWRLAQGNNTSAADVTFRVVRPNGPLPATMFTGVRNGPTVSVPSTPNSVTVEARTPISVGDTLGLDYPAGHGVIATSDDGVSTNATFSNMLANGDTRMYSNYISGELMVNADVEADADHDGFGDETQDLCPTNAAVQTACPSPSAPATHKKKCKKRKKKRTHSAQAAKKKHCKKRKQR